MRTADSASPPVPTGPATRNRLRLTAALVRPVTEDVLKVFGSRFRPSTTGLEWSEEGGPTYIADVDGATVGL